MKLQKAKQLIDEEDEEESIVSVDQSVDEDSLMSTDEDGVHANGIQKA